ncbi:MAG: DesA family fatty acid desaturase [Gammaproteobacteria bacterium]
MQDALLLLDGLVTLPWWGYIVVTLVMTHVTIVSVTLFLHRHQAHRAIDLHPALAHFFRFWLFLTTGLVTKQWVAVHRKHHAHAEAQDDPHSPHHLGINKVLWSGAEVYGAAYTQHPEILETYGSGTPDDGLERYVYGRRYGTYLGIFLLEIIYVLLFGAFGLTMWAIHMMWIPFLAAGVINGLGHWRGYRNHACPDGSTNLVPWGILIGGEEMHNNHHAFAGSAKFSSKPWEFDIGWFYIRILCACGLARVKKVAPRLYRNRGKTAIDEDTVQTIRTYRLQVLADYAEQVLKRIYREERLDTDTAHPSESIEALLERPQILMDNDARKRLAEGLRHSPKLAIAYQFQKRLDEIGQGTNNPSKQHLEELVPWYREAQTSGIQALARFAGKLSSYSLQAGGRR